MRVLFMGTPDFAAVILKGIIEKGHEICGVVTQPDKPKGRGYQMQMSPVKEVALEKNLSVYQPMTLKDESFASLLDSLHPDIIVVAAYGKILPKNVLDYPAKGCINAHASLLPKYRGAAPIQRAILDGEKETGVTAMCMAEGLDTGDMICRRVVKIEKEDNFETLHDKLALAGVDAILEAMDSLDCGTAVFTPQDEEKQSYAKKIEKEDGRLDFSDTAEHLFNRIRALSPFPLSFTHLPDGKLLKIVSATYEENDSPALPGEVTSLKNGMIEVQTGKGRIQITGVLPEGKGRMKAADFINGRRIAVGDILKTN